MGYIVDTLLGSDKEEIVKNIASGIFKRHGGIVRVAPGQPNAGRIVTFLRDVAGNNTIGDLNLNPLGLVTQNNVFQLHRIEHAVQGIATLAKLSTGVGIANLGLSAVGFLVMNRKLNKISESINVIGRAVNKGFADLNDTLSKMRMEIAEIHFLQLESRDLLGKALDELACIRKDLCDIYLARIQTELEFIAVNSPHRTKQRLEDALRTFMEARNYCSLKLDEISISSTNLEKTVSWAYIFRIWCLAVNAEVAINRILSDLEKANEMAQKHALKGRSYSNYLCEALFPKAELDGVHRFQHSCFENSSTAFVTAETLTRILRAQENLGFEIEPANLIEKEIDAKLKVEAFLSGAPLNWPEKQVCRVKTLDFVCESVERLESLAAETEFCLANRLSYKNWEQIAEAA